MSAYPIMLEGSSVMALVVGGGAVATRKVMALLESGATVRVVAPDVTPALDAADAANERLHIVRERYDARYLEGALIVVAATSDHAMNATIADDARGRLINVVTAPHLGNFVTPATHRAGDVVVAVSAGGVPTAAARIRDRVSAKVDARYAAAVDALAALRRELLDAGENARWSDATSVLIGSEFCDTVEAGTFDARLAQWR